MFSFWLTMVWPWYDLACNAVIAMTLADSRDTVHHHTANTYKRFTGLPALLRAKKISSDLSYFFSQNQRPCSLNMQRCSHKRPQQKQQLKMKRRYSSTYYLLHKVCLLFHSIIFHFIYVAALMELIDQIKANTRWWNVRKNVLQHMTDI